MPGRSSSAAAGTALVVEWSTTGNGNEEIAFLHLRLVSGCKVSFL